MVNEQAETIQTVVKHFKSYNPAWVNIKCYVTDKDFTAIQILGEEFVGVRGLLCQWHMIKYIGEEVCKQKYHLTKEKAARVRATVTLLIYSTSENEYDDHYQYLLMLFHHDATHPFFVYFETNWHRCREMWATYLRDNLLHLGNNTNNR